MPGALKSVVLLWAICLLSGNGLADRAARAGAGAKFITGGFDALYNLDYEVALSNFRSYTGLKPSDPAGHVYLAVASWTQELHEDNELDLERFATSAVFGRRGEADRAGRNESVIKQAVDRAIHLAEVRLQENARDQEALYYLGAAYGVMAGYQATVKKSGWKSFRNGSKAFQYHQRLLRMNPKFYDAYLTQGVYNYITGSLPFSVKIFAFLFGYRGDKDEGLRQVRLAAEEGEYVGDDAKLVLSALLTREKRYGEAARILEELGDKYPRNHLVELDRAHLYLKLGRRAEALALYREILVKRSRGLKHFNSIPLEKLQRRIEQCVGDSASSSGTGLAAGDLSKQAAEL
ncbi:MAG: tetratricopeptide repeat protein [Acidobacteria bacterium]|nr:tetratricopeptide repeat protein [Acidobacteriota bacterium]